jgi:hypothetical protein
LKNPHDGFCSIHRHFYSRFCKKEEEIKLYTFKIYEYLNVLVFCVVMLCSDVAEVGGSMVL